MKYLQHPLSAVLPNRNLEELESIANCEAVVNLTADELAAFFACNWFCSMSASQRAFFAVSMHEWQAKGSNQHATRVNPRSPRAMSKAAQAAVQKAGQRA